MLAKLEFIQLQGEEKAVPDTRQNEFFSPPSPSQQIEHKQLGDPEVENKFYVPLSSSFKASLKIKMYSEFHHTLCPRSVSYLKIKPGSCKSSVLSSGR